MTAYEYKVKDKPDAVRTLSGSRDSKAEILEDWLNRYGDAGYDLVAVEDGYFIFKKEKRWTVDIGPAG